MEAGNTVAFSSWRGTVGIVRKINSGQ